MNYDQDQDVSTEENGWRKNYASWPKNCHVWI